MEVWQIMLGTWVFMHVVAVVLMALYAFYHMREERQGGR